MVAVNGHFTSASWKRHPAAPHLADPDRHSSLRRFRRL